MHINLSKCAVYLVEGTALTDKVDRIDSVREVSVKKPVRKLNTSLCIHREGYDGNGDRKQEC